MDIIQKMKMFESQYSNTEKKVYHTILENPKLVDQYAITGLAGLANTSTSAVLRFCQTLGYRGYKDFRFDMVQFLRDEKTIETVQNPNPVVQISNIFSSSILAIQEINSSIFEQLARDLLSSRVIYTMGVHRSFLPAEKLRYNLEDYGLLTLSAGSPAAFDHYLYAMPVNSTIVLFSVSGHTYNYRNLLKSVSQLSPKIWLVTTNPNAQMKKFVKDVITLPSANYDKDYALDDHTVMMAFVELISFYVQNQQADGKG